jgi:membrane protease YdiL (CAAX protease family)
LFPKLTAVGKHLRALACFLVAFYAAWTTWCVLLIHFPDPLERGDFRALARLFLWIVPTLAYVQVVERQPVLASLGLTQHVGRGVFWGAVMALLHPVVLAWYRTTFRGSRFELPLEMASWLNPVVGAPLAEELLFRGLVFQRLEKAISTVGGIVVSSVLFALSHFPYWFLSGAKTGWDLAAAEAEMFVYGVVFAVLFRVTGSLWAPLVYHVGNNVVGVSLRAVSAG